MDWLRRPKQRTGVLLVIEAAQVAPDRQAVYWCFFTKYGAHIIMCTNLKVAYSAKKPLVYAWLAWAARADWADLAAWTTGMALPVFVNQGLLVEALDNSKCTFLTLFVFSSAHAPQGVPSPEQQRPLREPTNLCALARGRTSEAGAGLSHLCKGGLFVQAGSGRKSLHSQQVTNHRLINE
jgi:hypothetical protein